MGYTHYWYRKPGTVDDATWAALLKDSAAIVAAAQAQGIALAGWDGEPETPIEMGPERIGLNGAGDDACESFVMVREVQVEEWEKHHPDEHFECCKTRSAPYDPVVCALLLAAAHHLGDSIRVSSDGDWPEWQDGRRLYRKALGREAECPWPESEPEED